MSAIVAPVTGTDKLIGKEEGWNRRLEGQNRMGEDEGGWEESGSVPGVGGIGCNGRANILTFFLGPILWMGQSRLTKTI